MVSQNGRGWGEDAFIGHPCNPHDPHSHPRLTVTEEVEGGLPKRAAHTTSVTHTVTSSKERWSGRGTPQEGGPRAPVAHTALRRGQNI